MKGQFGKNLKLYRKERKLSQEQLARKVGVTQQCVSEWEKDRIEPTLSNLWAIADIFDVSVDELIGRTQ